VTNVGLEAQLDHMLNLTSNIPHEAQQTADDSDFDPQDDNDPAEGFSLGPIPFRHPVPKEDNIGNSFLLIVDSRQAVHLPVVGCGCAGAEDILQYLDLDMFPASYQKVRTVFIFACLDDFRISNSECKTSAYQYFQKI
jgi:hypothetical protein